MNPFASATRRSPSCRFALLYEAAEGRVRTTGQLLLADPANDDIIPRLIDPTGAFHQKQGKNPQVETSPVTTDATYSRLRAYRFAFYQPAV